MVGGGLLSLVAMGAQDRYLMGNPDITYFKTVYRRNFEQFILVYQDLYIKRMEKKKINLKDNTYFSQLDEFLIDKIVKYNTNDNKVIENYRSDFIKNFKNFMLHQKYQELYKLQIVPDFLHEIIAKKILAYNIETYIKEFNKIHESKQASIGNIRKNYEDYLIANEENGYYMINFKSS